MKAKKPAKAKPASPRKAAVASRRKSPPVSRPIQTAGLPEILFEGDRPGISIARSVPRPSKSVPLLDSTHGEIGELPEAYGTGEISALPRDPHWIYVHWDFTREQLRQHNELSRHGHLVLRIFKLNLEVEPLAEVHVHPESKHWFLHVEQAGARYLVELGYHAEKAGWTCLATSEPIAVPPDSVSVAADLNYAILRPDEDAHEHGRIVTEGIATGASPILVPADAAGLVTSPHGGWPDRSDAIPTHIPSESIPSSWTIPAERQQRYRTSPLP